MAPTHSLAALKLESYESFIKIEKKLYDEITVFSNKKANNKALKTV